MNRTQFAAAGGVLAVAASLITAPGAVAAVGDAVVYTVTSDGPLSGVSWYDATGTLQQLSNQPVPWSVSITNKDPSPTSMLVVSAVPTGQKTTCQVSVNGTVKDTKSSTGAGESSMVQCSTLGNP
jgi:Mycobacterium membrane protein